ncbi:MAG: hypothetical protein MUP26_04595 [Desulfobulbaceae bacterium]|nr:hypothetical protein [Desulfobulbaceae bacterium]
MSHPPAKTMGSDHHLSDEDRMHILQVFEEEVVPRLIRMDAKIGNLNCEFAGEKYRSWVIEFRTNRSGFEIVDFEYDEHSRQIQMPTQPFVQPLNDNV